MPLNKGLGRVRVLVCLLRRRRLLGLCGLLSWGTGDGEFLRLVTAVAHQNDKVGAARLKVRWEVEVDVAVGKLEVVSQWVVDVEVEAL